MNITFIINLKVSLKQTYFFSFGNFYFIIRKSFSIILKLKLCFILIIIQLLIDEVRRENADLSAKLDVYKPLLLAIGALFTCIAVWLTILTFTGQRNKNLRQGHSPFIIITLNYLKNNKQKQGPKLSIIS